MKNLPVCICLTLVSLTFAVPSARAQQTAHALSGTITSILPNLKMIEVATDEGTTANFQWVRLPGQKVEFDKTLSTDTTPVNASAVKGNHVIIFYCGEGDPRTAIALRDLGSGPVKSTSGAVVKLDRHEHTLVIKDISGNQLSFQLDPKTVADTPNGVSENFKFDLNKGEYVQVVATGAEGTPTALLVAAAL